MGTQILVLAVVPVVPVVVMMEDSIEEFELWGQIVQTSSSNTQRYSRDPPRSRTAMRKNEGQGMAGLIFLSILLHLYQHLAASWTHPSCFSNLQDTGMPHSPQIPTRTWLYSLVLRMGPHNFSPFCGFIIRCSVMYFPPTETQVIQNRNFISFIHHSVPQSYTLTDINRWVNWPGNGKPGF